MIKFIKYIINYPDRRFLKRLEKALENGVLANVKIHGSVSVSQSVSEYQDITSKNYSKTDEIDNFLNDYLKS